MLLLSDGIYDYLTGCLAACRGEFRCKRVTGEVMYRAAVIVFFTVLIASSSACAADNVGRGSGIKVTRTVKIRPDYFITMKNGKIYKVSKVVRNSDWVKVTLKNGREFRLDRRKIKSIKMGCTTTVNFTSFGVYSKTERNIKKARDKEVFDKHGAWKTFGGMKHWSDAYGNNKSVRR